MFKKIYISIKSYIIGKKLLKAQYFINNITDKHEISKKNMRQKRHFFEKCI